MKYISLFKQTHLIFLSLQSIGNIDFYAFLWMHSVHHRTCKAGAFLNILDWQQQSVLLVSHVGVSECICRICSQPAVVFSNLPIPKWHKFLGLCTPPLLLTCMTIKQTLTQVILIPKWHKFLGLCSPPLLLTCMTIKQTPTQVILAFAITHMHDNQTDTHSSNTDPQMTQVLALWFGD